MISGYCWPQSAAAGECVELFVSCATPFRVEIHRQGIRDEMVWERSDVVAADHPVPADVSARGCAWPPCALVTIADDWRSGFYLVSLTGQDGTRSEAFFVVRASEPGDALLVLSTSTWHAYNDWGGTNYYNGGHTASLVRPLAGGLLRRDDPARFRWARLDEVDPDEVVEYFTSSGNSVWIVAAGWSSWEYLFVQWAERAGVELDYAVSADLETVPGLLDPYRLYLSVGHDEYWSAGMRDAVETFVDDGGRAAFFSGNTSFWQIRHEPDERTQVAYKTAIEQDPLFGTDRQENLSTMWSDPLVGRPENAMTGVTFTRGGYAHVDAAPRGSGGYTVWRPGHWAFDGVELRAGDLLGAAAVVVGYECDGCDLRLVDGLPAATGVDGTPPTFTVLATAPAHLWADDDRPPDLPGADQVAELNWVASRLAGEDNEANRQRFAHGAAVMGHFTRGRGEVFTTGCTDWAFGLDDPAVAQVTSNVIDHFLR